MNKKIMLDGSGKSKKIYTYTMIYLRGIVNNAKKIWRNLSFTINKLISINKLVSKICRVTEKKFEKVVKFGPERIGQDKYYNISAKKIERELNWKAKTDIDLGLLSTYKWVYDNLDVLKKMKLDYIHKE